MESITAEQVAIKMDLRLNKSGSQNSDAIWMQVKEEAFNKALLEWFRRQIRGKNQTQDGDEETQTRIDDLQVLLKEDGLNFKKKKLYYQSEKLPSDYFFFKRLSPIVSKDACKSVSIVSYLEKEANVDILYPTLVSFKFEETLHTLINNRVHIYHNDEFELEKLNLVYYRYPKYVSFKLKDLKQSLELKKDIAEMIIDEAVKILASDIESVNQKTLAQERVENNG
jgi:hypothetical protein